MSKPLPLPPLVSYNPKVSMDPAVYYKTQKATYDRLAIGYKPSKDHVRTSKQHTKSASGNRAARREAKRIAFDLFEMVCQDATKASGD